MTRATRRSTIAGYHRLAKVGLVTPLRDGMNLVAKEFVAAQDRADPGVLILSEFAGAAETMVDALIVNPFDADGVADAIHRAVTMPLAERQARNTALLESIRKTDARRFCATFLGHLATVPRSAVLVTGAALEATA